LKKNWCSGDEKLYKSNKNSVERLSSQVDTLEGRILGLEGKVDIVEKSDED
jgi:hypothetical protein